MSFLSPSRQTPTLPFPSEPLLLHHSSVAVKKTRRRQIYIKRRCYIKCNYYENKYSSGEFANYFKNAGFEILTTVLMKTAYCLVMAPCRIAVQDYTDTEEGGSKLLRNVGHYLPIDTVPYRRKLKSSCYKTLGI